MAEKCKCTKPGIPSNLPSPADTYKGTAACIKCGGTITFPINKKEVKKTGDPVVDYLANRDRFDGGELDGEKAIITMLLRVEKALLGKGKGK